MIEERKFYLTKEGWEKLKKEYTGLKRLKIAKTKGESPKVLQSEDLNPEYLAFQEDLNFLEMRLIELESILKNTVLIKPPQSDQREIVNLGATISVDIDGQNDEFQIVGTLEANPTEGKISNESPVGKALLGHRVGDSVLVTSPIQTIYKIKRIKYKTS